MSNSPHSTASEQDGTNAPGPGLSALLTKTAIAPLPGLAWLRITGEDRVRWLNGMVTNSIQALTNSQGCYSFLLNAQGRIQGDATTFALPDSLLLQTSRERLPALTTLLDRFIIMDDVQLREWPEQTGLLVAGPRAATMLDTVGLPASSVEAMHLVEALWPTGETITLLHAHSLLVPRFELWASSGAIADLSVKLHAAGAIAASASAVEHLRLLEGTPLYGVDIRDRELPQETAQNRALHFTKGCYLGQEIVERIRSRGNVHRTFAGFTLAGELPAPGALLSDSQAPEKAIGELTSVARIDLASGPIQLGLGYIRREALHGSAALTYPGGTASPVTLPLESVVRYSSLIPSITPGTVRGEDS